MIRAKLKDNTGASITYALLLFLVCAVVSSIVLAAGTAASGRISNSVSTDYRYYSVTSAAELLEGLFDGVKVVTQTTKVGETGDVTLLAGYPKVYKGNAEPSGINNYELLKGAARKFVGKPDGNIDIFPKIMDVKVDSTKNADLKVDFFSNTDSGSESARLIFKISSYDPDNTTDIYTLYLVFDADIDLTVDKKTKETYDTVQKKVVATDYYTNTIEMTWTLTNMSTTKPEGSTL